MSDVAKNNPGKKGVELVWQWALGGRSTLEGIHMHATLAVRSVAAD